MLAAILYLLGLGQPQQPQPQSGDNGPPPVVVPV